LTSGYIACLAEQFSRGGPRPSNPRALECLVSRASELAYLLRSLIKLSLPPPPGGWPRKVQVPRESSPYSERGLVYRRGSRSRAVTTLGQRSMKFRDRTALSLRRSASCAWQHAACDQHVGAPRLEPDSKDQCAALVPQWCRVARTYSIVARIYSGKTRRTGLPDHVKSENHVRLDQT